MKKPVLEVHNLQKSYNGKEVLQDVSLAIYPGEIVGLLGPNGAGKTTAFYIIIGLIRPDKGEILFQGSNISLQAIHKRAQMGMGYLAQEPSIFRSLTVEENLLVIVETLSHLTKSQRKEKIDILLEELHLSHLRKKKASTLSGGERRRLEITRALVKDPTLLLLDEPFANIDPLAIQDVKNLIRLLQQKNISVLITDHNAREIFSIVERSYLIQEGKVMLSGTKEELLEHPEARRCYFGENFAL